MPYRKKHFLEMSDRERESRRAADMNRKGRDAIEGYYPEVGMLPIISRAPNILRAGGAVRRVRPDIDASEAKEAANKIKYDTLLRQIVQEKPEEEKQYKKGGVVKVRGGGCEQRGKTRGRFV
jgi:hypothetical protein